MPSFSDLLARTRREVREVSLAELLARIEAKDAFVLIDVRERDELREGMMPGALSIPRGFLEQRIEQRVPDRQAEVVVYCAGTTRSALAARTLAELGYQRVAIANAGFSRWKDLGYPIVRPPQLTDTQRDRYSRHLLLPEVGETGQIRLHQSKVLLIGAGGLGSPAALYLAAAGVGTLGIIDSDRVEASNLQRQVLHATSRVGEPKVESARKALTDLNPDVVVKGFDERLSSANVERVFEGFDVVVDGTDNFPTRYLVNDASVWLGIPVVHGSVFRFDGQVTTFLPPRAAARLQRSAGPCYRCLYPEPPPPQLAPSCQEAGVLGILPGLIGLIQATEAIKLVLGLGTPLVGRLLTYDSLRMSFRELKLRVAPDCPVCGPTPTIQSYVDYEGFCNVG